MTVEAAITLTWSAFTGTDKDDDDATIIDMSPGEVVAIQGDTTATANTDTDIDLNVYATLDDINWDTEPFTGMKLGDNQIKMLLVSPGPLKIKLTADQNGSGNAAPIARIARTI